MELGVYPMMTFEQSLKAFSTRDTFIKSLADADNMDYRTILTEQNNMKKIDDILQEKLLKRLRIAEDIIRPSKRDSECVTAEDWRRKAEWYEYNWRCCSEGFNEVVYDLKQQLTATQSKYEPLSDKQLVDLWDSAVDDYNISKLIMLFARAVEKAHGIGVK